MDEVLFFNFFCLEKQEDYLDTVVSLFVWDSDRIKQLLT